MSNSMADKLKQYLHINLGSRKIGEKENKQTQAQLPEKKLLKREDHSAFSGVKEFTLIHK